MPFGRSSAEILGRLAQMSSIAAERAGLTPRACLPAVTEPSPRLPFPLPSRRAINAVYAQRESERDDLLRIAHAAGEGRFSLLGHGDLQFGKPVDWHFDPIRGKRAPMAHWSRVPFLESDRVGDHKLIWELNRHQWMVTLAQAWRLTNEDRHLQAISGYLEDWLEQNPPTRGINWASSLEVAFRAIAWTWVLHLAGDAGSIPRTLRLRLLESLALHGRHVEKYLSRWFSANTHLTGEALGLLYLGSAWPDFPHAARWRALGWEILTEQLPIHLREDGTYFEQSTWYLGYTVDFWMHAIPLAAMHGWHLAPAGRARIEAAVRALGQFQRHDGTIALIGDDDGGRLLPLVPGARTSFADTMAIAAGVLDAPGLAVRHPVPAGAAWVLGEERWGTIASQAGSPDLASEASTQLPDGGWYFLRLPGPPGSELSMDAGPHGALTAGHAHADALAFELSVAGQPLLVDPGTFSYAGPERDEFRSTAAHNTLTLAGEGSARPAASPFRWQDSPVTEVEEWNRGEGWDFLAARHDGFTRRWPGVIHERRVLRWKDWGWLVLDRLTGSVPAAEAELRFHLAAGLEARGAGGTAFDFLAADSGVPCLLDTDGTGAVEVEAGWVSRCYGSRERSSVLVRRISASSLSAGVATVLQRKATHSGPVRDAVEGGSGWTWQTAEGTMRILLRAPDADAVRHDGLVSTARFCAVISRSPNDHPAAIVSGPGSVRRGEIELERIPPLRAPGAA